MFDLQPPRHISTLPNSAVIAIRPAQQVSGDELADPARSATWRRRGRRGGSRSNRQGSTPGKWARRGPWLRWRLRLRLRGQACECRVARPLARADAQLHALANVDTWLSQIDRAIAEMTKRGRTNGVLPPSTRGARPVVIWSLSASGKRASHWLGH